VVFDKLMIKRPGLLMRNSLLAATLALVSTLAVCAQVDRITEPIHNQLRVRIDGHLRQIDRM
jgi:hypothetical protein